MVEEFFFSYLDIFNVPMMSINNPTLKTLYVFEENRVLIGAIVYSSKTSM